MVGRTNIFFQHFIWDIWKLSQFCAIFSSPEPLSVVRPPFSKIFSKTAGPIKAKFHVERPWVVGNKRLFGVYGSHD